MSCSCTIDDLPDSILLRIFSFVAWERLYTLFRLRYVCRKWKALASDSHLWRRIFFPHKKFFTLDIFERLVSWCDNIVEVDISFSLDSPEDIGWLDVIVNKCQNIRILKAEDCPMNKEGLKKLSESCVRLRELVLTPIGDVTSDGFIDIIRNTRKLERLEITMKQNQDWSSGAFYLSEEFLKCLLSSGIKRFRCVGAGFSNTDTHITAELQPSKLEELEIICSPTLTDEMIKFIACKSPNLKTLNVKGCENITEQGISCIVALCPLLENFSACKTMSLHAMNLLTIHCKNVHTLDLIFIDISDDILEVVSQQCQNLKRLVVSGGDDEKFSHQGIAAISTRCSLLTYLDLWDGTNLDDSSLYVLAENAVNLKELCIFSCEKITGAGVHAVAQKCIKLEALSIHSDIEIEGLKFASEHQGVLCLKQIMLTRMYMSDTDIENITKVCPKLEVLELESCGFLTDQALLSIAKNCPDLTCLSLAFDETKPVSHWKAGLLALSNMLSKLQNVKVTLKEGCMNKDVFDCMAMFVEKCPFLSELEIVFLFEEHHEDELETELEEIAKDLQRSVLRLRSFCYVNKTVEEMSCTSSINVEMTSMLA